MTAEEGKHLGLVNRDHKDDRDRRMHRSDLGTDVVDGLLKTTG